MRIYEELFIVKPDVPEEEIDQLIEQRQRSIERRQAEILRLQGEILHPVSDIAGWMTVRRTVTPMHITSYN